MLAVPGTVIALVLPVSPLEKLLLIGVLVLVLIIELMNSSIEAIVDRVSLERHPLSKNAKDLGSAAVFLAMSLALATWLVIAAAAVLARLIRRPAVHCRDPFAKKHALAGRCPVRGSRAKFLRLRCLLALIG